VHLPPTICCPRSRASRARCGRHGLEIPYGAWNS